MELNRLRVCKLHHCHITFHYSFTSEGLKIALSNINIVEIEIICSGRSTKNGHYYSRFSLGSGFLDVDID